MNRLLGILLLNNLIFRAPYYCNNFEDYFLKHLDLNAFEVDFFERK